MSINVIQKVFVNKISQLCEQYKISHVIGLNKDKSDMIVIFCNNTTYNRILKNNFYVKHCKNVFLNITADELTFDISGGDTSC
jgi:hypothetical protein